MHDGIDVHSLPPTRTSPVANESGDAFKPQHQQNGQLSLKC